MNTYATLTPTLSLGEGEGAVSIPSPPGERDRVRGRTGPVSWPKCVRTRELSEMTDGPSSTFPARMSKRWDSSAEEVSQ